MAIRSFNRFLFLLALTVFVITAGGCPTGPADTTVLMPDLAGQQLENAQALLVESGLVVGEVSGEYSADVPGGVVLSQTPTANTSVSLGTVVAVVVSKGPELIHVPDVLGMPEADAKASLSQALLVAGTVTQAFSDTVEQGNVVSQDPIGGASVLPDTPVQLVISLGPQPVLVPSVVGLSQADAEAVLADARLTVGTVSGTYTEDVAADSIIAQNPAAGTSVLPNTPVDLLISMGPQPVPVPNVVGLTQVDAQVAITNAGLITGSISEALSNTVPSGSVIEQTPAWGSQVLPGTRINLTVSKGSVPDLVGLSQSEAEEALIDAGLSVGTIAERSSDTQTAGRVLLHAPPAGALAPAGTGVDLVIAKAPEPGSIGIHSVEELQRLGNDPAYPLDGTYFLNNDIDASATAQWNNGEGFMPIGYGDAFDGLFDGQNYSVSELYMHRQDLDNAGLFSEVEAGVVQDLILKDCVIRCAPETGKSPTGGENVGGIAGTNKGTVVNCHVVGEIGGYLAVGGLIGTNTGTIERCSTAGAVTGLENVGGVVGLSTGPVRWSASSSRVKSQYRAGGLIGRHEGGEVTDCHATGVTSGDYGAGGLIGLSFNSTPDYGPIARNCATGTCFGRNEVGGLISSGWCPISDCFATGPVVGSSNVGGLIGGGAYEIARCYASGLVSGYASATGLADGLVRCSFWDTDTSGIHESDAGVGRTTTQMTSRSTFVSAGWDMTNIWTDVDGVTYPHFANDSSDAHAQRVIVTTSGQGQVSVESVDQAWAPVLLTATPDPGYAFVGWDGPGIADESRPLSVNPLPLARAGEIMVHARFLPDTPISIATIEELQRIGNDANYPLTWDYVQTSDIDAAETDTWNNGTGFEPIGAGGGGSFSGTYDGQGYEISGLHIAAYWEGTAGLFAEVGPAGTIVNVHLVGGEMDSNTRPCNLGPLAGTNSGTIDSCSATCDVGTSFPDSTGRYCGGLVGRNQGTLTGSHAGGRVKSTYAAGGLAGIQSGGTVSTSYANGEVTGENIGGLIGMTWETSLTECYATTTVTSGAIAGGLIGDSERTDVAYCYAAGRVDGRQTGGLIGTRNLGSVASSFWDTETTSQSTSAGGTGKTTAEMMTQSTFTNAGWDFANTWTIEEGITYPRFLP